MIEDRGNKDDDEILVIIIIEVNIIEDMWYLIYDIYDEVFVIFKII